MERQRERRRISGGWMEIVEKYKKIIRKDGEVSNLSVQVTAVLQVHTIC